MASHLTVTTNTAGMTSSKGLNGTGGNDDAGNAFAALLGSVSRPADPPPPAAAPSPRRVDEPVKAASDLGTDDSKERDDADAVAAVVDPVVPLQDEAKPLLADIIAGLADLQARLAAGEPLDEEALKRLDAALTQLADALHIDLAALPSMDELAALAAALPSDDASFEARLTAALGPLAQSLLDGSAATDTALADQLKAVGDKLAALLAAFNGDDKLSLKADAELNAALAKLTAAPLPADEPQLAKPALKLTEPALTGKADSSAPAADPAAAAPKASATDAEVKTEDRKPTDARVAATAAAVDTQPETGAAAQPPGQAARVDALAAARVVQPGYQTSQQQLNLPQLAFEMVRQVTAGNARFQIRLDPPELGKIDVRLDIDASGRVSARLTVEKAETLDLMQRDQRGLERALQQAGLDASKTNLEFSLKQNPFSGGQDGNGRRSLFDADVLADADEAPPPTVNLYRGSLSASGVNILA